jgi:hypothetical protein
LPTNGWSPIEPRAWGIAQSLAFRINRLRIFKNREWGAGEFKMISFVSTGDEAPSAFDGLLQTSDPAAKRKILRDASRQMLSVKEFIWVEEFRYGHVLTFGDSGYALYTDMRIPVSLNWTFLILESDEDLGKLVQRLVLVLNNWLVPCQSFPGTADFLQDHLFVSPPLVSLRLEIPLGKVSPDGIDQLVGASKTSRKDHVLAQITEESFDQIEPRSAGRREVEMKAGMSDQPSHHLGVFMGSVVVQNQEQVDPGRGR